MAGENEAYLRITVARAAPENPALLDMLRDGRLHLSGIARLAPHLTPQNSEAVLKRASGMSHREIRELVCELEPNPDVAPTSDTLPHRPQPGRVSPPQLGAPRVESDAINLESKAVGPGRPPVVEPLAPGRYQVRFTAGAELRVSLHATSRPRFCWTLSCSSGLPKLLDRDDIDKLAGGLRSELAVPRWPRQPKLGLLMGNG